MQQYLVGHILVALKDVKGIHEVSPLVQTWQSRGSVVCMRESRLRAKGCYMATAKARFFLFGPTTHAVWPRNTSNHTHTVT